MTLRETIVRVFIKAGIGLIDILILALALVYIYLAAQPLEDFTLLTTGTVTILLTVIVLYLIVVVLVSLFLTYMREDNWTAKTVKAFISTICVMALFNIIIFPLLWLMGYSLSANVQLVLTVAAVMRLLARIFLRRYFGRYFV